MASRIKAIGALRPKIDHGDTVQKPELLRYLGRVTSLSEGQIDLVIKEVRDAILFFNLAGRGVNVEGMGIYKSKIGLDGEMGMSVIMSKELRQGLDREAFTGKIINAENIGKTADELVQQWDVRNPNDIVQ